MDDWLVKLVIVVSIFFVFVPFHIGRQIVGGVFWSIYYIVTSPWHIWRKLRYRRTVRNRRQNYEVLGQYISVLGDDPESLKYFRSLVESDISPEEFQKIILTNIENLKKYQFEKEEEAIRKQKELKTEQHTMAVEQQELLQQSQISLEQIKFREQLLEQLYQKIKKKYRL